MAFQLKPNFVTIAGILFLVVLVSMVFSSHSYIPYDGHQVYTAYEGFQEGAESDIISHLVSTDTDKKEDKKESTVGGNVKSTSESFSTLSPSFVSGTDGLYPDPVNSILSNQLVRTSVFAAPINRDEHIDKFLDITNVGVEGVDGCKSSGLSNSRGQLCLSPELIQSLQTRGVMRGSPF